MVLRFLPLLMVMGAIFLLSHTPGDDLPAAVGGVDKLCHTAAYTALGVAALFAVHPRISRSGFWKVAAGIIFFCLFYGITDEFHQSFIPGRFPSWQDVVADGLGGLLAALLWQWWRNRRGRSRPADIS